MRPECSSAPFVSSYTSRVEGAGGGGGKKRRGAGGGGAGVCVRRAKGEGVGGGWEVGEKKEERIRRVCGVVWF